MSWNKPKVWILAAALTSPLGINSATGEREARLSDYKTISARNPFNLRPPDPPKLEKAPVATPKSQIFLTGISTLVPPKRAYLKTKDPSAKEEQFYALAVAESKDGLEVLEIDEVQKTVLIRNGEEKSLLSFATHGVPAPVAPAAPAPAVNRAAPGSIPLPPGGVPALTRNTSTTPVPGIYPANSGAGTSVNTYGGVPSGESMIRSIPTRNIRTANSPVNSGVNWTGAGADVLTPTPLQDRYNRSQTVQHQYPGNPQLTPEEQVLMLELQRTVNPDLPPTPGLAVPLPPVPGQ